MPDRPCVLVFAGVDPSGGAGVYADVQAIAATGAHAVGVVTALTAQDHNRVFAVYPVPAQQILAQANALISSIEIAAVKIGIVGSRANAECIAALLVELKTANPNLPVVLDPVLASGHGDALTSEDAVAVIAPLLAQATLLTPNLPEAKLLCNGALESSTQVAFLRMRGVKQVLIKGGHGQGRTVVNTWFKDDNRTQAWEWPRLSGAYHGSGCTLAAAIAGRLAMGDDIERAMYQGQLLCQQALQHAFAIGSGQLIPCRTALNEN